MPVAIIIVIRGLCREITIGDRQSASTRSVMKKRSNRHQFVYRSRELYSVCSDHDGFPPSTSIMPAKAVVSVDKWKNQETHKHAERSLRWTLTNQPRTWAIRRWSWVTLPDHLTIDCTINLLLLPQERREGALAFIKGFLLMHNVLANL